MGSKSVVLAMLDLPGALGLVALLVNRSNLLSEWFKFFLQRVCQLLTAEFIGKSSCLIWINAADWEVVCIRI